MEKHRYMEVEGDGRQHESLIPEPVSIAWKLYSEEMRRHWTPTGYGPKDIGLQYKVGLHIAIKLLYLIQIHQWPASWF